MATEANHCFKLYRFKFSWPPAFFRITAKSRHTIASRQCDVALKKLTGKAVLDENQRKEKTGSEDGARRV